MQIYDIVMLVVLGIATFMGAIKGFAWQIASLASIVASYFVAYIFRNDVAKLIHAQEPWNGFLAMLLLYAGSSFAIWVVFRLLSNAIDQMRLRDFDRHMGALVGLGKGVLYCLLITMFAVTLLGPRQQQAIVDSRSGSYISQILSATDGIVWPKEVEQIVRPYLEQVEQRLEQRNASAGSLLTEGSAGSSLTDGLRQRFWPTPATGTPSAPPMAGSLPGGWHVGGGGSSDVLPDVR